MSNLPDDRKKQKSDTLGFKVESKSSQKTNKTSAKNIQSLPIIAMICTIFYIVYNIFWINNRIEANSSALSDISASLDKIEKEQEIIESEIDEKILEISRKLDIIYFIENNKRYMYGEEE